MSEILYLLEMMNGADGISDIEHARSGIARVDCNAARVAGASTGSANDQGKATRVGASEWSRGDASDIDGQNREVEMGGST